MVELAPGLMIVMGPGFTKSLPAITQLGSLVRSLVVQTAGGELLCKVISDDDRHLRGEHGDK